MVDWTKPIQTRDGLKARLTGTDFVRPDGQCMTLEINGDQDCNRFPDGTAGLEIHDMAIINVPEKRVVWLNMYPDGMSNFMHQSLDQANKHGNPKREACVRVEYEIGQFDEEGTDSHE